MKSGIDAFNPPQTERPEPGAIPNSGLRWLAFKPSEFTGQFKIPSSPFNPGRGPGLPNLKFHCRRDRPDRDRISLPPRPQITAVAQWH